MVRYNGASGNAWAILAKHRNTGVATLEWRRIVGNFTSFSSEGCAQTPRFGIVCVPLNVKKKRSFTVYKKSNPCRQTETAELRCNQSLLFRGKKPTLLLLSLMTHDCSCNSSICSLQSPAQPPLAAWQLDNSTFSPASPTHAATTIVGKKNVVEDTS